MNSMYPKTKTLDKSPDYRSGPKAKASGKTASTSPREPPRERPGERPRERPSKGRRTQVRRSGIHGKGVFAVRPFAAGERVMEYTGEVITWKQAQRKHPHDPDDPFHTFFFHIDDKHVIDGGKTGNSAKWINHACGPNCEAEEIDGRIFIHALRDIEAGEELNYDYGLMLEERHTAKVKKQFGCRCGTPQCRGTMLAPKR